VSRLIKPLRVQVNPDKLHHPSLAAVRDYWMAKRGTRSMPSRADLDPGDLKEHLPAIVLVDVGPRFQEFRYRLIGTHVALYFGEDNTGRTPAEAFGKGPPNIAEGVLRIYREVAGDHVGIHVSGDGKWLGSDSVEFEALHLPLTHDGQDVNMLLIVFAFDLKRLHLEKAKRSAIAVGRLHLSRGQRPLPAQNLR
jgi:hypothetical protein